MKTKIEYNGELHEWVECLEDFCGNYKHSGFWADLWQSPSGHKLITFGGAWEEYAGPSQTAYIKNCFSVGGVFEAKLLLPIFRDERDPLNKVLNCIHENKLMPVIKWENNEASLNKQAA